MKQYNFTALRKLQFINGWKYFGIGVGLLVLWLVALIAGDDWETVAYWLCWGWVIALVLGSVFCFIAWQKLRKHNRQVFTDFAAQNNMTFIESANVTIEEPSSLFGYGHSRRASEVLKGETNGLPFQLFNYTYTEGHGKYAHTYNLAMAAVELPYQMPQLVIDSLIETGSGRTSVLPIDFKRSQKLTLEGDFSQYFALYAPEQHAVDALTVLAPDIMHTLIEKNALCDIEIIGRRMYFYWPKKLRQAKDYEQVLEAFESVMAQVAPPLKRMRSLAYSAKKSEIVGKVEPAKLKRVSAAGSILGIMVLVIGGLYVNYAVPDINWIPLVAIVTVIIIAALLQSFVRERRYSRLRRRHLNK
ncbi:MAG TPA: hypothetical protein VD907_04935 [Verrucomicrobiae bacterium]|nr:hypothetical protein [Verrucomicrobiae bacterium]